MNHRAGAAASPHEITLQDFSQAWVLGRHLEQKVTGLRVQIMEVNGAGFWVRRLTRVSGPHLRDHRDRTRIARAINDGVQRQREQREKGAA